MTSRSDWFLTSAERGNSATRIDERHGGLAWTAGNSVTPLVHGRSYFARLHEVLSQTIADDIVLFTDWRGDPDERLNGPGPKCSTCSSDSPSEVSESGGSCGDHIPTGPSSAKSRIAIWPRPSMPRVVTFCSMSVCDEPAAITRSSSSFAPAGGRGRRGVRRWHRSVSWAQRRRATIAVTPRQSNRSALRFDAGVA